MKYFIFIITLFTFISCDPGYAYYISNNSEKDIYVYTNPPIKVYDKSINRTKLIELVVHYHTRFIFRLLIFLSKINLFKN